MLEMDFTYRGMRCVIIANPLGFRCGYVGVGKEHPLHGVNYTEVEKYFKVHGGLTFSGGIDRFIDSDLWYFGFDCGHYNDGLDFSIMDEENRRYRRMYSAILSVDNSPFKTTGFCVDECRSLATQLDDPEFRKLIVKEIKQLTN